MKILLTGHSGSELAVFSKIDLNLNKNKTHCISNICIYQVAFLWEEFKHVIVAKFEKVTFRTEKPFIRVKKFLNWQV